VLHVGGELGHVSKVATLARRPRVGCARQRTHERLMIGENCESPAFENKPKMAYALKADHLV
jgi:hypothetical protein